MKKIIYVMLISLVTSLTIASCTEEGEVTPAKQENGGGGASDPK